jgi:ubiquinone/menaquinone biosynthesis C-methylase UbiE
MIFKMKKNFIVKKIIEDFKGKGKHVKVPNINKYCKLDVNICKFSGLVTVINRRSDKEIANDWSEKIFSKKFSKVKYSASIPAVIARQTYVLETLSKLKKLNKLKICDIGAGQGQFLDMVKKKFPNIKTYGIEPSKINSQLLNKKKHENFCGTIQDYAKSKNFSKKFDVITVMWTLVNTSSCFEMIEIANKMVKDNGIIILAESSRILVPFKKPLNMYFSPLKPDLHPFHFSKNSLSNLLLINRFDPIFVNRYIDTDYLVIAAKKIKSIRRNKIKIDNFKQVCNFFKRWHKESKFY